MSQPRVAALNDAGRPVRPFEYLHWARAVPAGAAFPMHTSGMPPFDASELPVTPAAVELLAPPNAVRERLKQCLLDHWGRPNLSILFTTGASEATFVALAVVVAAGAGVAVEETGYRAMERACEFLGGRPVAVPRHEHDSWELDPERVAAVMRQARATVLAITDPHNPTGNAIDVERRARIIDAVEGQGGFIVVDEIFAPFRGDQQQPWAAQSKRVLSVGSFTKGWGLGNLRLGWLAAHPDLIARAEDVFTMLGVNPPTPSLALAAATLPLAGRLDARAHAAHLYVRRLFAAEPSIAGSMVLPQSGLTGFLRLPPELGSERAALLLREHDSVQTVPGHFFGADGYLRVGFAGDDVDWAEGLRRIAARVC